MTRKEEQKEHQEQTREGTQSEAIQTSAGQSGGNRSSQQTGIARREQTFPSVLGSSPFTFMRRFSEEMDRLFEDFGMGRGWLAPSFGREILPSTFGSFEQTVWWPQVEAFERGGKFIVRADLPGLKKDDVKVEVTDEAITLSGERRQEHEEKGEGYYRTERSYGSFYRQIPLPEGIKADDATATFQNGVLEISMQAPQREERRSRQLQIKDASEGAEPSRSQAAGQKR